MPTKYLEDSQMPIFTVKLFNIEALNVQGYQEDLKEKIVIEHTEIWPTHILKETIETATLKQGLKTRIKCYVGKLQGQTASPVL